VSASPARPPSILAPRFDGARIDAITRAAGVNKALLYYTPNKAELYRKS